MKILSFQLLVIQNQVGGANLQIIGLGDDNKMYSWIGKKKEWELIAK